MSKLHCWQILWILVLAKVASKTQYSPLLANTRHFESILATLHIECFHLTSFLGCIFQQCISCEIGHLSMMFYSSWMLHCNPLQGKYRFFTGISLCTLSHLHALAVYRVWGVKFHWNTGKYIHSVQELAIFNYMHVYVFITGISLFLEKQQHRILQKQGKPCK